VRVHNTTLVFSPDGADRPLPEDPPSTSTRCERRDVYRVESCAPGDRSSSAGRRGGVGLSICYDLRFPELYRAQAVRGARWLVVPSAFARATGKDHWEVLLRARAIENQCFVLAPAQCGVHSSNRASHGRSLIVDPWGIVLAQLGDRPGVAIADCSLAELERVRASVPALRHRVL
jgi:predicted amidohydrolase